MIERSQFGKNKIIYENNKFGFKNFNGSFLEYYMRERENLDCKYYLIYYIIKYDLMLWK